MLCMTVVAECWVFYFGSFINDEPGDCEYYQFNVAQTSFWRCIPSFLCCHGPNAANIYLDIYLVWLHQNELVQSTRKPMRVFLKRCRWFLKQLTECTSNACWSRLFHLLVSLSVKKLCLTSKVLLCLTTFNVCPLRCFVVDNSNIDSRGIADQPLAILNTSMS